MERSDNALRDARDEQMWTQEALSLASGVSVRTIQRIESGAQPSRETALALAAALDVDVRSILPSRTITEEPAVRRSGFWSGVALLSLPAWFAAASVLKYNFGFDFLHRPFDYIYSHPVLSQLFYDHSPKVFAGCMFAGMWLLLRSTIRIRTAEPAHGDLEFADWNVSVSRSRKNAAALALGAATVATFVIYLVSENLLS